jgi:phosphatidylethanolamine/phosphatidyl-N-methylethanolamine N-methyltransferase
VKPLRPDWLRFVGHWLRSPRRVAAIAPSSPGLAAAMLAQLPPGARRVIELGGGTGAITGALLEHGIAGRDLLVLELGESLHAHLRQRFPEALVVLGDAAGLPRLARAAGFLDEGRADAVVSSLGLLAMERDLVKRIVSAAFECLGPGGRFIQFTYGPASPVPEALLAELGLGMRRGGFVLRNVPPATVYVYERLQA